MGIPKEQVDQQHAAQTGHLVSPTLLNLLIKIYAKWSISEFAQMYGT